MYCGRILRNGALADTIIEEYLEGDFNETGGFL